MALSPNTILDIKISSRSEICHSIICSEVLCLGLLNVATTGICNLQSQKVCRILCTVDSGMQVTQFALSNFLDCKQIMAI